tara:strand:+ start:1051 stop:2169 length:1119 start_codon:yes stop_codon:yes gene_type:complete
MPKFQKNTGFSLKSGNRTSFKAMGSSPLKEEEEETNDNAENWDLESGDVPDIVKRWQFGKAGAEGVEEKYRKVVDAEGNERYISKGQGFGKGTKEYLEERYDEPGYNIWTDESLRKRLRDPSAKYHTKAEMYKDTAERKHGYKSGKKSWRGEELASAWDPTGKSREEIREKQLELQRQGYNIDYQRRDGTWVRGEAAADGDLGGPGSKTRQALAKQAEKGGRFTDEQRGYNPWLRKARNKYRKDNPDTPDIDESTQLTTGSKIARFLSPMSSEERRQNRLERKIKKAETARSTGKLGISFNLLSGFRVEPKADILQRKIDKLQHKQNVAKYKQDVEREYDALSAEDKKTTPAPTRRKKVQETKEKLIDKVKK